MARRAMALQEGKLSLAEALRGLVAFLSLAAMLAAVVAGLLFAGERPGPPPAWPRWEDVARALQATEPPLEGLRYGASMAGWLLLAYVAAVLLLHALAGTLAALTGGAAWARELERLTDLVTIPWVRKGLEGGLLVGLLAFSMMKTLPELPRPSAGGDVVQVAPAVAPGGEEAVGGAEAAAAAPSSLRQETEGVSVAGEMAPARQVRVRPELPAPVVPGQGAAGQVAEEGDEAPPPSLGRQGAGVRLPGQAEE